VVYGESYPTEGVSSGHVDGVAHVRVRPMMTRVFINGKVKRMKML